MTGVTRLSRLTPPARAAVSSWSALNRPKTSSMAVSNPIGSEKEITNGTKRPNALVTPQSEAWPFTTSASTSFMALPIISTAVKMPTVSTSVAST